MDKSAKNSKGLRKFWSEKLAEWQISGKNGSQWCRGLEFKGTKRYAKGCKN